MKVIEHIQKAQKPLVSIEIIPPRRGGKLQQIHQAVQTILPYSPPFINITSHSAEVFWEEAPDGTYKRRVKRKSPGTFGLCAAIKYKFNLDPVPHVLCAGFTREETEDALIELNYLGVENVLAIRGDGNYEKPMKDGRSRNEHAVELVKQVRAMNEGIYLDELIDAQKTDFCVGVAAYPEKHFESPNLAFDINILKQKQEAGAHYAVTQMFFDNAFYYEYVKRARAAGVTIPIIPGLKILTGRNQIKTIPRSFFISFPEELVERVQHAEDDKAVRDVGLDWAYRQAVDLIENGAPCVHFYIMHHTAPFIRLMELLKKHL